MGLLKPKEVFKIIQKKPNFEETDGTVSNEM